MALTEEQLKEMDAFYNLPKHGFSRGLPGVKDSVLSGWTRADYTELWGLPFKDYLEHIQSEGFDIKKTSNLDDIFRAVLDFSPPYKMYDIALEKLSDKTFGELLSSTDKIIEELKREEQEINADYTENYGQKKDNFLKAVHYMPDGHEIDFFFRYWRRPLMKLMTDRGVNLFSDEGEKEVKSILKDLFGSEYVNYDMMTLLNETPEHLVEQKKEIEAKRKEFLKNEELEKEMLFDKPFFETLEKFIGIRFSDKTDIHKMVAEAYARPDAHDKLKEFLKTKENLDKVVFAEVLGETPRNIVHQSDRLSAELTERQDNDYLMTHPTATFGEFLKARRDNIVEGTLEGEKIKQEALQFILNTENPVDNKAVKEAHDISCQELNRDWKAIVSRVRSRKVKKMIAISATLSGVLALLAWTGYKTVDAVNRMGQKTVPMMEKTTAKIKETFSKKDIPEKEPSKQQKVSSEQASSKIKESKSVSQSTIVKGNALILGNWQAWEDNQYRHHASGMFQHLLTSEFNYLMNISRESQKPLYQQVNIYTTCQELIQGNVVKTRALSGEEPVSFYVKTWGSDQRNLKSDLIHYHMNIKDVLDNLPGNPEKLAEKQLMTMEAIGPAMGWSIRQQKMLQQKNPQATQEAQNYITLTAEHTLAKENADKNDMDAVFTAVMKATKSYRQVHPECNFLLLSADSAIRKIAGIEHTDTKQISSAVQQPEQEQCRSSDCQGKDVPKKEKQSKYPWLWIIGTAALTSYLGSEYWKGKAEIVK